MSASVSASATGSDPPSFQFTKDAIEHEHAVLLHILREEGLADDWARCLEGALIEMSNIIESRGWMEGIRKAREEEILDEEEKERWDPEARLADINRAILAVTKSGSKQDKKDGPKHLVLTISSPSTFVPTIRDASGARVANRYACKFEAGTWTLPRFEYDNKVMGHGGEMILGLAEWVCGNKDEPPPSIIGGTFAVRGIKSPAIYESLCRVMRIAVYVHLAIHLELSLMRDLHVKLTYPPPPAPPPVAPTGPTSDSIVPPSPSSKKHGLWGLWAKTSELVHGLHPAAAQQPPPALGRYPSLTRRSPLHKDAPLPPTPTPGRSSLDSHARPQNQHYDRPTRPSLDLGRVFSSVSGGGPPSAGTGPKPALPAKSQSPVLPKSVAPKSLPDPAGSSLGGSGPGVFAFPTSSPTSPAKPRPTPGGFAALVETIKSEAAVLSTSPGIVFDAPALFVRLAEKELDPNEDPGDYVVTSGTSTPAGSRTITSRIQEESSAMVPSRSHTPTPSNVRRPTGDEKAGLASVLGWKGNTGSSADMGTGPGPGIDLRNQWRANSIFGVGERGLIRAGSIFGSASPVSTGSGMSMVRGRGRGKIGKEWKGRGMCGVAGFVRHQGLTVLYAEYVDVLGGMGMGATRESTLADSTVPPTTAADVTGLEVTTEPGQMSEKGEMSEKGSRPSSGYGPPVPAKNEATNPSRKATAATRQGTLASSNTPAPKLCMQAHWRTYRYFRFGRSPWEMEHTNEADEGHGAGVGRPDSNIGEDPDGEAAKRDLAASATGKRDGKESPTSSRTAVSSSAKGTGAAGQPKGAKGKEKEVASDGSELVLDEPLGLFVARLCKAADADESCLEPGCSELVSKHRISWIHNRIRVTLRLSEDDDWVDIGLSPVEQEDNACVRTWVACAVCSERTEKKEMGPGGFLFSLAKFLELLIYSPSFSTLDPPLCAHTTASRHAIVRYFSHSGWMVAFETSEVRDVYEVKVPKVRMLRTPVRNGQISTEIATDDRVRAELRLQITDYWKGIKDYLDELEAYLEARELNPEMAHKRLPTTPPESDTETEKPRLPRKDSAASPPSLSRKASQPALARVAQLPPLTRSASMQGSATRRGPSPRRRSPVPATPPPPPPPPPPPAQRKTSGLSIVTPAAPSAPPPTALPLNSALFPPSAIDRALLKNLREQLKAHERNLYDALSNVQPGALNDLRREFIVQGRGAVKRIEAWEKKHAPEAQGLRRMKCAEPAWWGKGVHVIPGSDVIVREGDLGSIIAFTLSSTDYALELENLRNHRVTSYVESIDESAAPSKLGKVAASSMSVLPSRSATPAPTAPTTPDPDEDDPALWGEAEPYSTVIMRKEHPRDVSLLNFRDVLRHKRTGDSGVSIPSKFTTMGMSASRVASGTPPSAWSKPAVEVSTQLADGQVSSADDEVHKLLTEHYGKALSSEPSITPTQSKIAASTAMLSSGGSLVEVELEESSDEEETTAPAPPPKEPSTAAVSVSTKPSEQGTLTSVLASAMKYVLNPLSDKPFPVHHVGLMAVDPNAAYGPIDERPHIKYDWTVGTRLKFSCTAYFARQFDALRRRCGVAEGFNRSLAESANWLAEGGKSKANFFKTSDDRYIIKSLVNAWNVADLQILIEMAPSYFRYIDSTHSKASVLAKMLGFYTIEVKNLETGATQTKADVLVMENLMYGRTITQTFDLKGIKGRKVKPGGKGKGATLFDGEWIEGASRALLLVRPHSKLILQEAVRCDAEFLAKANIMDYSLLLGVDEEHSEIACGLVDTIGSYTFAKTLENKAKSNLQSGREVTVVPPTEYQERFVKAMERYFLACPDKWSKPSPSIPDIYDPALLPSVL